VTTLRVGVDVRALFEPAGGLCRYASSLLPALISQGRDVEWRLYSHQPLRQDWGASVTVVPGRQQALLRPLWESVALPSAVGGDSLDVFLSPYGIVPPVGCPVVATLHDLAFLEERGSLSWRHVPYWRRMARRLHRAAAVIAVSEATRSAALRRLDIAPDRVVTIPNGVDTIFRPSPREHVADVRARLGLDGDFVLTVAPWIARKNLPLLAEAVGRVGALRGQRVPLVVVGEPDAAAQRPFPHVVAPGAVDDATLVSLISAAGVFAVPSLYEGFGLTLIEAMACGAPCIASDAGALPDVAGGAALLVPPRDVHAWSSAINRVLTEPPLNADLRERGLIRARAFSWVQAATDTLAVIARVAR
jgi:glycosyltransferase involved in cell wall biosynthesis